MNDRELLELAAKAAGIELSFTLYPDGSWLSGQEQSFKPSSGIGSGICVSGWNPLEDDGDALRLSAELGLNIFHSGGCAYAMPSDGDGEIEIRISYGDVGGKFIATRRAITRAAAEIGKGME